MDTKQAPRKPRLKTTMTATAFALVQIRNAWRMHFLQLRAHRQYLRDKHQDGWGA